MIAITAVSAMTMEPDDHDDGRGHDHRAITMAAAGGHCC
jgi:hypothetical protein